LLDNWLKLNGGGRLRRIRTRCRSTSNPRRSSGQCTTRTSPHRSSQSHFETSGYFFNLMAGDPATCMINLGYLCGSNTSRSSGLYLTQAAILPRILSKLQLAGGSPILWGKVQDEPVRTLSDQQRSTLFTYIMRINYTGYCVRRSQDVYKPFTSHCNIMVWPASNDDGEWPLITHSICSVIGIYHVNVVFVGPGMSTINHIA